jgi:hypothetical protein
LIERAVAVDAAESIQAAAAATARLSAAKQAEAEKVVAAAAAHFGPPMPLPSLKYLEVGCLGTFVGCRLAQIAPQLTCLRIGCPGESGV